MDQRKSNIPHEDSYKRINFLYQAAYKCLKTSPLDPSLCRYYMYNLRTITKRLTLHMHPDMKRSMCGRCCILLVPGITARIRYRNKRQQHAVVTCLECGTFKRYVGIPERIQWIDKDENWEDTVTNGVLVSRPEKNKQNRKKNKGTINNPNNSNVTQTDVTQSSSKQTNSNS